MDFTSLKDLDGKELFKAYLPIRDNIVAIYNELTEEEKTKFEEDTSNFYRESNKLLYKVCEQGQLIYKIVDTEKYNVLLEEYKNNYSKLAIVLADFMNFFIKEWQLEPDKIYVLIADLVNSDLTNSNYIRDILLVLPEWIELAGKIKSYIMSKSDNELDEIKAHYGLEAN
jgi:hypothetical protein